MARSFQQKLKILYLLRAFQEKTDEQHPMTVSDLIDYLEEFGITVERKTVYDDIETLRTFGLDIANRRSKPSGFYLASRDFELAELKLLADASSPRNLSQTRSRVSLSAKLQDLPVSMSRSRSSDRLLWGILSRMRTRAFITTLTSFTGEFP